MSLLNVVWIICLILIIYTSMYFSFNLKFPQFNIKKMLMSFKDKNFSSTKLLFVVLGGRIGVGSIAGVSLAIHYGGIGSIFWMIISVFFCAVITFCETILGCIYKEKIDKIYVGGPSFYLKNGISNKKLGVIYAILILICYIIFFIGIQSNTISKILPCNSLAIGLILSIVTFIIIIGGLKKITFTSSIIVPIMTGIYLIIGLFVAIKNIDKIPNIFMEMVTSAFNYKAFFTGMIPCIIIGFQRGIFANESGLGTGTMVSSSSNDNPIKQGFIQMAGIYITTLIICLFTSIIVLTSNYEVINYAHVNGIEITMNAFTYHFGSIGKPLLICLIVLFAFSTITTIYYYGEVCLKFLSFKSKTCMLILKILTSFFVLLGTIVSPTNLWNFVDILVGIIIIINMYAILKLKNKILLYVNKLR